jgi:hypothetical protein
MTTTIDERALGSLDAPENRNVDVEHPRAVGGAAAEGGVAPDAPVGEPSDHDDVERDASSIRPMVAALCTCTGAAVIVGGVFTGAGARLDAIVATVLGGVLAFGLARVRSLALVAGGAVGGLLLIGVVIVVPVAPDALGDLLGQLQRAVAEARAVRPPIDMTAGFAALVGWIMAVVGFVAVWCAVVVRKAAIGMLLALPVAGIAAISVPKDQQIASGLALAVLFGIGLGVLSGGRSAGTAGQKTPLAFELRRMARAFPFLAVVVAGMYGLSQAGFLFPTPVVDPTHEAQKPTTVPITKVPDRDLFDVKSKITGPWVLGTLDVYDGSDWRLPPIADSKLVTVPSSGVVDSSLQPGLEATITVRGLGGAVLPGLANSVAIETSGPSLAYDTRSQNIRLVEGQIDAGFTYRVAAAGVPPVSGLINDTRPLPAEIKAFLQMPPAPPAVRDLISRAPHSSPWAEFDWIRQQILQNVTAAGPGTPVSITPDRVQQILGASSREASPFEIVAMQAMLARWVGLPARIGYGFDGGDKVGDHLEVHPKHGAAFPEVYFPGYAWLPVIGTPQHAKVNENNDPHQQQRGIGIAPSRDITVPLFVPMVTPPPGITYEDIRNVVLIVVGALVLLGLLYLCFPLVHKAYVRSRRRRAAVTAGPRARVVEAYAEWRDALTDFGYADRADTPLMLLQRFADDPQHRALAWLVTRGLWGDLQSNISERVVADAEELSRTLRRRLAAAHPITVRGVAALSRLSLRHPYEPEIIAGVPTEVHDVAV